LNFIDASIDWFFTLFSGCQLSKRFYFTHGTCSQLSNHIFDFTEASSSLMLFQIFTGLILVSGLLLLHDIDSIRIFILSIVRVFSLVNTHSFNLVRGVSIGVTIITPV
jgi:hypothetical protein